jgi:hypothetical protein
MLAEQLVAKSRLAPRTLLRIPKSSTLVNFISALQEVVVQGHAERK